MNKLTQFQLQVLQMIGIGEKAKPINGFSINRKRVLRFSFEDSGIKYNVTTTVKLEDEK